MTSILNDPPSELVAAIDARVRKTWTFEAANFLSNGPPLGKYRMRVATVTEQDEALEMAKRHVRERVSDPTDAKDPDLIGNAKVAYIMHRVCLHAEKDLPAFPSGKWMLERFSTDELSVLLNHYSEILKLSGPIDMDLSTERIEGLAALMANHSDSDAPNIALVAFTREQMSEICIRLSMLLKEEKDKAAPVADRS